MTDGIPAPNAALARPPIARARPGPAWDPEPRDALALQQLAHELRNPLAAMKALVQLGLRDPAEAAAHGRLSVLEKELARMQEMLARHASLPRPLDEARLANAPLRPVVDETLALLSAQATLARVRLTARGDATAEVDPRRLREALVNLIANAIQATPPGGEVVVEVRSHADEAEIEIRDTGRGMRPETLRRLGTPFFTTRQHGTGLGVVLARSVIALHGGTLRYESAPGRGTTVKAILPRRPRAA
jgi:signal transduction histidine kinase